MNSADLNMIITGYEEKTAPGIFSVGYRNIDSGEEYFYKGDHVFPSASVVKVCIMLEYFRQVEEGILSPDRIIELNESDIVGGAGVLPELHRGIPLTLRDLLHLMIVVSDNSASNILLDVVGMKNVNLFMKKIGLKDTVIGRKFMIDPNTTFAMNFTSTRDFVLMYDRLFKGRILGRDSTLESLEILSRQQYREKIPLFLPQDIKIAHKTGEISGVRHDCAMIYKPSGPYILCILTEKVSDEILTDRLMAEISLEFYNIS